MQYAAWLLGTHPANGHLMRNTALLHFLFTAINVAAAQAKGGRWRTPCSTLSQGIA